MKTKSKMDKSAISGRLQDIAAAKTSRKRAGKQHPESRIDFYQKEFTSEFENAVPTPFCNACNKSFRSVKLLQVHQQTHDTIHQQTKDFSLSSSEDDLNICEDLSLNKKFVVKEEPIELVSEPEIENLLNNDPHPSSNIELSPHRNIDFYPDTSRANSLWRNFTETSSSSFPSFNMELHSSVPIKLEPADVPAEPDQFDFILNEILQKPGNENIENPSKLSIVAEEIPLQQNFWTQSDQQAQNEQDWLCDICNRNFSSSQILHRHRVALHDQNKDFKCDQCDMWFSSSNNHELIKHVNEVHNGFKKFICDFSGCNKEFSRRDALKRHRQTHESQKAKIGMKQITGKKISQEANNNFSCFDCGLHFRYQTSLILHLKNHK